MAAPRGAEGTGANAGAPSRHFTGVWNWLRWEFTAHQKALLRLSVIPERLIHGNAGGRWKGKQLASFEVSSWFMEQEAFRFQLLSWFPPRRPSGLVAAERPGRTAFPASLWSNARGWRLIQPFSVIRGKQDPPPHLQRASLQFASSDVRFRCFRLLHPPICSVMSEDGPVARLLNGW